MTLSLVAPCSCSFKDVTGVRLPKGTAGAFILTSLHKEKEQGDQGNLKESMLA